MAKSWGLHKEREAQEKGSHAGVLQTYLSKRGPVSHDVVHLSQAHQAPRQGLSQRRIYLPLRVPRKREVEPGSYRHTDATSKREALFFMTLPMYRRLIKLYARAFYDCQILGSAQGLKPKERQGCRTPLQTHRCYFIKRGPVSHEVFSLAAGS
jgi:hypothetical protein